MSVLAEAALLAFYSTAEAVAIVLTGVVARWNGHLDGYVNGRLSRFCMRITFPALCLSLYDSFSAAKLARWWTAPIVCALHILLGALLGRLAGAALQLRPPHKQILVMSAAFANCGAVPFVLVVPLFSSWSRTKDDPVAVADAFSVRWYIHTAVNLCSPPPHPTPPSVARPNSPAHLPQVIGLYLLAWILLFFSVGRAISSTLRPSDSSSDDAGVTLTKGPQGRDSDADTVATTDSLPEGESRLSPRAAHAPPAAPPSAPCAPSPPGRAGRWLRRARGVVWGVADRNLVCMLLAVAIGCIPPLKVELQGGGLKWVGSVWSQLGKTNVVLSTILLGSALQPDARLAVRALVAWVRRHTCSGRRAWRSHSGGGRRMRTCASGVGNTGCGAGVAAVRLSGVIVDRAGGAGPLPSGAPLRAQPEGVAEGSAPASSAASVRLRFRVAAATILIKLVLMPAICIPLQVRSAAPPSECIDVSIQPSICLSVYLAIVARASAASPLLPSLLVCCYRGF